MKAMRPTSSGDDSGRSGSAALADALTLRRRLCTAGQGTTKVRRPGAQGSKLSEFKTDNDDGAASKAMKPVLCLNLTAFSIATPFRSSSIMSWTRTPLVTKHPSSKKQEFG